MKKADINAIIKVYEKMEAYMKKDILNNYRFKLVAFLCAVFLLTLSTEFLRLTKPLFDKIYYGYLSPMIIDLLRIIFYFVIFFLATGYANKHFSKIEYKKIKDISTKRIAILYGMTILVIFIVTAILGFRLKLVVDLGENLGMIYLYNNLAKIIAGLVRMLISFTIIRYTEELFKDILNPTLFKYLPVGGIASMITIGLFDFIISPSKAFIDVLFMLFHIIYGYIYRLSYNNKAISLIIMMFIRVL